MSKISIEWTQDRNGNHCLQATKKRGTISIAELQEEMRQDPRLCEYAYAIIFPVREDCYDGWSASDPDGDALYIYQLEDGATCPICYKDLVVDFCPHCGERIREEKANHE